MKKAFTLTELLLVLTAIVLFVVGTFYIIHKNKTSSADTSTATVASPTPALNKSTDQTLSTWQQFSTAKTDTGIPLGLTFKYPQNWEVRIQPQESDVVLQLVNKNKSYHNNMSGDASLVIWLTPDNFNSSIDAYLTSNADIADQMKPLLQASTGTIDGKTASLLKGDIAGPPTAHYNAQVTFSNGYMYSFQNFSQNTTPTNPADTAELDAIFNKILSTVHFQS